MTPQKKALILDITGAAVSFLIPAAAAAVMFPAVVQQTGNGSFLAVLHLSAVAFAIIAVLLALTLYRFFRDRIKVPKSGLTVSLIAFGVCYGIEQFIHALTVVLLFCVIGAALAQIFYAVADHIRRKAGTGGDT